MITIGDRIDRIDGELAATQEVLTVRLGAGGDEERLRVVLSEHFTAQLFLRHERRLLATVERDLIALVTQARPPLFGGLDEL